MGSHWQGSIVTLRKVSGISKRSFPFTTRVVKQGADPPGNLDKMLRIAKISRIDLK
jgi:hypothetical protein